MTKMLWTYPPQHELDLLLAYLTANVANYWNEWYRQNYVAAKTMRVLALDYNE